MIYFYQNPKTKEIIDCDEKEAWTYHYIKNWEQIGASSGEKYKEITNKAKKEMDELLAEMRVYENSNLPIPSRLWRKFKELDRKVVKAVKEGIAAELEEARGKFAEPPDNRVKVLSGEPHKVRKLMESLGMI